MIRRMAEELGVHHEALRNWIRQAEADAGERNDLLTTDEKEELAQLRRENRELRRANEVLRTASAFFRSSARPDPAQVRAFLDEHPHLRVEPVLRELNIPSSTYYRWCQAEKAPCRRCREDTELASQIRQIHQESGGIYGAPRVHAILKREGVHVGRKRVERLMRQSGLAGISRRKVKGFTRRAPDADLAPDLVQRDFTASAPNRPSCSPRTRGWSLPDQAGARVNDLLPAQAGMELAYNRLAFPDCSPRMRVGPPATAASAVPHRRPSSSPPAAAATSASRRTGPGPT
ncbi:IS3 family transposase [Streptomyces sp. NPDC014684]|uniref:IS3 family transposase n=1 Tax=Streptomyces sp. NPDC014684 TaxID=3364880 RepID=UPI0036FE71CB